MTDAERRLQFLENQLQRNERWTSLADAKAGVVLVSVSALSGLAAPRVVGYTIDRYSLLVGLQGAWWQILGSIFYGVLIAAIVVFAFLALWNATQAILPRTKVKGHDIGGNIFFHHVSDQEFKDYSDNILRMTPENQTQEYIRQVYVTSKICNEKYINVQLAMQHAIRFVGLTALVFTIALVASGT